MTAVVRYLPADGTPLIPNPDAARAAARAELAHPPYHAHEPSLMQRFLDWIAHRLRGLLEGVGGGPGSWWVAPLLVALLIGIVVAIRARLGPLGTRIRRRRPELFTVTVSAADHHRRADAALACGDLETALLERFRALARDLEEQAVLVPRPGRTADEVAAEAGALIPDAAGRLHAAATAFNQVRYGGRPGTRAGHDLIADAVAVVRTAPAGAGSAR